MNQYGILNSRKRAFIALIHTVVFGLLAAYQFLTRQHPVSLLSAGRGHLAGPLALTAIYSVVTVILLILLRYSGCTLERLYFGFCATSAAIGFLRSLFGDPTTYAGSGVRVMLLGCAIIAGTTILRSHAVDAPDFAN